MRYTSSEHRERRPARRRSRSWSGPGLWVALVFTLVWALALGACFSPTYPENLPCDPDGWCPPGQMCSVTNLCVAGPVGDGDAMGPDGPVVPYVVAIDLGPDITLDVGATEQLMVIEVYSDGAREIVADNELVIWRSSDNNIVWFNATGLATGESAGMATVTARYQGLADAAEVTVTAP